MTVAVFFPSPSLQENNVLSKLVDNFTRHKQSVGPEYQCKCLSDWLQSMSWQKLLAMLFGVRFPQGR
jgi:hypothetical protein